MLEGVGTYVQLTINQRITDTSTVGNITRNLTVFVVSDIITINIREQNNVRWSGYKCTACLLSVT